jgi:hypothetical protein
MSQTVQKHDRLQLSPSGGEGQVAGVLVWDDLPVGALVTAHVERGSSLVEEGDDTTQPYAFELAPLADAFTAGGVSHRTRGPVLVASGESGPLTRTGREPAWAAFGVAQTGSLIQRGKKAHAFSMPGGVGGAPVDILDANKRLLRMRWTGTAVAGAVLAAGLAGDEEASGTWASEHRNLVPGSIILTCPTGGTTLRDDGKGNLHGDGGYGRVNYLTGEWSVRFAAAQTGDLEADYEHSCLYKPLAVTLVFDPIVA